MCIRDRLNLVRRKWVPLLWLLAVLACGWIVATTPVVADLTLFAPVSYTHLDVYKRQRLPERGSPLALWLIRAIALHVGRPVGRALLYPITLYFLMTAAAARRGSQRFLRRALGREPSWREVFRHIHCFAATILDRRCV